MNKQEKIESVGRSDYAWHNDGTVEQLREVLKMSFPNDSFKATGEGVYYRSQSPHFGRWDSYDKTTLPTHSVKDFFNVDEAEIKVGDEVKCYGTHYKVIHIHEDHAWIKPKESTTGCIDYLSSLKKVKTQYKKDWEKVVELMWAGYTSKLQFGLDLIKYARESK